MKNTIHIIAFSLAAGLLAFGCTKVSEPFYTEKSVLVDTTKRSVLLEDYTGHLCVNCAPAAQTANTIQELYKGEVFVIAVHAGNFAKPNPSSHPPYLAADYRCPAGNDWYGYSGFNIDGNPKGMVNRTPYNGQISFGVSDWNQAVKVAVAQPKVAIMTVHNTYDSGTKTLHSMVGVRFLASLTGKVTLTVCILEDSIYGGQLNNIPPDSVPIIKNFRFMHMLRGSLNGSWGEEIAVNPSADLVINKSYSCDFNPTTWVPEHCSVIAFISDEETRAVYQVVKSPELKP